MRICGYRGPAVVADDVVDRHARVVERHVVLLPRWEPEHGRGRLVGRAGCVVAHAALGAHAAVVDVDGDVATDESVVRHDVLAATTDHEAHLRVDHGIVLDGPTAHL